MLCRKRIEFLDFSKGSRLQEQMIAAVNRKDWSPTEHTVICSKHFIDNKKSNNQFAPKVVPTIFKPVDSPMK